MLTIQALQSSQVLAHSLDSRNIIVRPINGSVLDKLVKSSCNDPDYVSGDPGNRTINLSTIADLTNRPDGVTGMAEQNVAMQEVVCVVSEAVTKHLLVARTIVAPAVDDLAQRVMALLEQTLQQTTTQLEIIISRLPAPMMEPALVDSFMRAVDIPAEEFNLGMAMSSASVDQIREFTRSGVPSLDEATDQFLVTVGDEQLMSMFDTLFTTKANGVSVSDYFNNPVTGLKAALLAFLVSRKLWDNPPEGVEMSAQQFETQMVRMRDQSALVLIRAVRRVERDEANGILIAGYTNESVTVNESVYRKWINDGGNNDILFGNVLSNFPRSAIDDIAEKTDEYLAIWQRFCLVNRTTEANRRFTAAKQLVNMEFQATIRDLTHDELPLQDREMVVKSFDEALALTREVELADPYSWILRLLCSSRFRQTDAFRILDGINRIKAQSPGVDVREAAAVAAIEYIACWVSSQMVLDNAVK